MSVARDIKGPWLNTEVLGRVPQVQRQFDLNRDPYTARQIQDLGKTEKQRRDGSEDTGMPPVFKAVRKDKPAPALKPPYQLRGSADREGWLSTHRDAVLAQVAAKDATRDAPGLGRVQSQAIGMTRGPSL